MGVIGEWADEEIRVVPRKLRVPVSEKPVPKAVDSGLREKLNFRIPGSLMEKLEAVAGSTGKRKTDLVIEALHEYLDDRCEVCGR